jgi:CRISPR-associated protein Cmr4
VRSLAGCFAWLTCPAALERFNRDTGRAVPVPQPRKDHVIAGAELVIASQNQVVLEEYAMPTQQAEQGEGVVEVAAKLKDLTGDNLWQKKLATRLAIVHDENFQHFVTTCTEVVARIAINPETRTVKGSGGEGGGALFNQENVPCETLFYSVLTVLPPRRDSDEKEPAKALAAANSRLEEVLPHANPPILQLGGDETTGHGLCETKREEL